METLDDTAAWIRENRRAAFWRGVVIGAATMLLLTTCVGCASLAPTHYAVEVEHVSHPLVGWPFTDRYDEDELTQANGRVSWRADNGAYLDAALGVNLHAAGGFYGPRFTGTVRVGKEWKR